MPFCSYLSSSRNGRLRILSKGKADNDLLVRRNSIAMATHSPEQSEDSPIQNWYLRIEKFQFTGLPFSDMWSSLVLIESVNVEISLTVYNCTQPMQRILCLNIECTAWRWRTLSSLDFKISFSSVRLRSSASRECHLSYFARLPEDMRGKFFDVSAILIYLRVIVTAKRWAFSPR